MITKDDTLMLNGKGAEAHIAKRVEMLKDQIEVRNFECWIFKQLCYLCGGLQKTSRSMAQTSVVSSGTAWLFDKLFI